MAHMKPVSHVADMKPDGEGVSNPQVPRLHPPSETWKSRPQTPEPTTRNQ